MNETEKLTLESDPQTEHIAGLPVWVRPPRNSVQEFYTGLSKAKLYELAYCLKREWDEKGREQERYDYISHKLFNLLQRAGGAFSPDSRVSLDEKSSFKNN